VPDLIDERSDIEELDPDLKRISDEVLPPLESYAPGLKGELDGDPVSGPTGGIKTEAAA
jgi:hypothetical protein